MDINLINKLRKVHRQLCLALGVSAFMACEAETEFRHNLDSKEVHQILSRGRVAQRNAQQVESVLSLSQATQAVFQMHADPNTGELRWLLFDLNLMPELGVNQLWQYSIDWWRNHEKDFHIAAVESLQPLNQRLLGDGLISISFQQIIGDVPVKDAFVDFIFFMSESGTLRLREIVNQTSSLLPESASFQLEVDDLAEVLGWQNLNLSASRWLWCVDQQHFELSLCKEFEIEHNDEPYTWIMRARDHKILNGYSHHLALHGQINLNLYDRSYIDDRRRAMPLALAEVHGDGKVMLSTADGLVDPGFHVSHVRLDSPRVRVYESGRTEPEVLAVKAEEDGSWTVQEQGKLPAINAYASAQRINRYVRQFLSADEVDYLERSIEMRVNVAGECNAFYTTRVSKITLYGEGGGCANLALISDVIYHEWGHGLNEHTGRHFGVIDGAFSEGVSDLTSAFFTGDPEIGRGFVIGSRSGIRSLANKRTYPEDVGDVHREGGIIGGAFWDLRHALIERYGFRTGSYQAANLFFRHLLTADTYQDSYQSVLRLDSRDGNPANRSPNYCLINSIFAARGLAESAHCEDDVLVSHEASRVDNDLFLAFAEQGDGQLGLVASSRYANHLSICFGDRYVCLSQGRTQFHFSSLAASGSERRFFTLEDQLPLKGLDLVTIIAKNSRGQVIGSRVVKVHRK